MMFLATVYLIISTGTAGGTVIAIPYKDMESCQIAENDLNKEKVWQHATCIHGTK